MQNDKTTKQTLIEYRKLAKLAKDTSETKPDNSTDQNSPLGHPLNTATLWASLLWTIYTKIRAQSVFAGEGVRKSVRFFS